MIECETERIVLGVDVIYLEPVTGLDIFGRGVGTAEAEGKYDIATAANFLVEGGNDIASGRVVGKVVETDIGDAEIQIEVSVAEMKAHFAGVVDAQAENSGAAQVPERGETAAFGDDCLQCRERSSGPKISDRLSRDDFIK
jgi:hypothetical protein